MREDTGETVYDRPDVSTDARHVPNLHLSIPVHELLCHQDYFEPGVEIFEGKDVSFEMPMEDIFRELVRLPSSLDANNVTLLAMRYKLVVVCTGTIVRRNTQKSKAGLIGPEKLNE